MDNKSPEAFRTISEVAEWLGVPAHVLRFWESRFGQVKPVKRAGGRRYYRPSDMELLGGIRKLLHDDGMTIRGVQKLLRENGVKHVAAMSPPIDQPADMRDVSEPTEAAVEDDVSSRRTTPPGASDLPPESVADPVEDAVEADAPDEDVVEAAKVADAPAEPAEPREPVAAETAAPEIAPSGDAQTAEPADNPMTDYLPLADVDEAPTPEAVRELDEPGEDAAAQDAFESPERIEARAHGAEPETVDADPPSTDAPPEVSPAEPDREHAEALPDETAARPDTPEVADANAPETATGLDDEETSAPDDVEAVETSDDKPADAHGTDHEPIDLAAVTPGDGTAALEALVEDAQPHPAEPVHTDETPPVPPSEAASPSPGAEPDRRAEEPTSEPERAAPEDESPAFAPSPEPSPEPAPETGPDVAPEAASDVAPDVAPDVSMPAIGPDPEDDAMLPAAPALAAALRRYRAGGAKPALSAVRLRAYGDRLEALSARLGTTTEGRRPF